MAEGSLFYPIIDSHVHLYPESELESISWIPQSSPLYEQKSIDQYRDATRSSPLLAGFVAIENDRKYTLESSHTYVPEWAGPLQEVSWLSRIALGEPRPGEGHSVADSHLCLGIIPFAPIAEGPVALAKYLDGAKKAAGGAWDKIKGFRYLLQDKPDGTALQDEFIQSLQFLGRQGYSFDVCVNYHRRGKQLLSDTVGMMERVLHGVPENQQITIVLDHLMKPDFTTPSQDQPQAFQDWASVVQKLASFPRTYVKLSGAFSEMPENQVDSWDTRHMASTILPWFEVVLDAFGPARILFGSDWPVCSEHVDESWRRWREVVEDLCYLTNLDNEAIASIFAGTAREAYRL